MNFDLRLIRRGSSFSRRTDKKLLDACSFRFSDVDLRRNQPRSPAYEFVESSADDFHDVVRIKGVLPLSVLRHAGAFVADKRQRRILIPRHSEDVADHFPLRLFQTIRSIATDGAKLLLGWLISFFRHRLQRGAGSIITVITGWRETAMLAGLIIPDLFSGRWCSLSSAGHAGQACPVAINSNAFRGAFA